MTKERLLGRNPKNEKEALINQIPQDKQEFIDQEVAIAESIVKAFRDAGFEAKISELAQNLQDQYHAGDVLPGETFRQLAKKAPFQWDKFGAVNLIVLKTTPESIYSQHFEEVEPQPYPDWPQVEFPKAGESWNDWNAAWEKRNQESRNWWLNRRIRILDVREYKQQVRDLAVEIWEESERENQKSRVLIGKSRGRLVVVTDLGDASLEGMKRKRFNQLHPRDTKGRFVKK